MTASCSIEEGLIIGMQASYMDQFSNACNYAADCIQVSEDLSDKCFVTELAKAAIDAKSLDEKKAINTKHIIQYQSCLFEKSAKDYWEDKDIVEYILSQVNKG